MWPRQLQGGGNMLPFLTEALPDQLLRGYEWLTIAVALSPEDFGTSNSSSSTQVVSASGVKSIQYDKMKLENFAPNTSRTTSERTSDVPVHLQFHFDQAKFFLEQLVRPGARLKLPGLPEPEPTPPAEKGYHTLSDFCV